MRTVRKLLKRMWRATHCSSPPVQMLAALARHLVPELNMYKLLEAAAAIKLDFGCHAKCSSFEEKSGDVGSASAALAAVPFFELFGRPNRFDCTVSRYWSCE